MVTSTPQDPEPAYDVRRATCPSRAALDHITGKWTVLVIHALTEGPRRFSDLRRAVEGVSRKMLTHTLRGLERDGLVARLVYPTQPPTVEYSLTLLGQTLIGPLTAFCDWAEAHADQILNAQASYDARGEPGPIA